MTERTAAAAGGIGCALGAALLFGASTPLAKLLVGELSPVLLAGLLYLGSGAGLLAGWGLRRAMTSVDSRHAATLTRSDLPWLAAAIALGGVLGPVLLMTGLAQLAAAEVALLLNLEGVFTALVAWFVFREHLDRRIAFGMGLIVAGGVVLAWTPSGAPGAGISPWVFLVAGACLAWAFDNNLTRKVSGGDAVLIAALKGLVAGLTNIALALALGQALPAAALVAAAGLVGFAGYGVSLVLFVLALRQLGAARTGAYFSTAPFFGAALALGLWPELPSAGFWIAAALMAAGVWLHLTERHEHRHAHEELAHCHRHVHDEHHQHAHDFPWDGREPHTHHHVHAPLVHAHPHYPDIHHRHAHD